MLGLVPARKGSKGILRKNLQPINGVPLFLRAAETLQAAGCDKVYVSTDDDTIASITRMHGFEVHPRKGVEDDDTVADVVRQFIADLGFVSGATSTDRNGVVVLQPTVPVATDVVAHFIARAAEYPNTNYIATAEHRHQMWDGLTIPLAVGVNRQDGGALWPLQGVGLYRFAVAAVDEPPVPVKVEGPVVDIDTYTDLHTARLHAQRKTILIRFVVSRRVGTGHFRRAVQLADALQHHNVILQPYGAGERIHPEWNAWVVRSGHQSIPSWEGAGRVDLVVDDILDAYDPYDDTDFLVAFENRGPDAHRADLLINAMYPAQGWHNEVYGADWAVLRPEFTSAPTYEVSQDVNRVMLLFGGTDPANLTDKALEAIGDRWDNPTVIRPGDDRPIAELMHSHDLLLTSAGRTVFEAAAIGIPTIVMAQNPREATHTHLGYEHGNVNLGLGRLVSVEDLRHTVHQVAFDYDLRTDLSRIAQNSIDGKGLERIVNRIDNLLEGL